jgi:hypothetical protein
MCSQNSEKLICKRKEERGSDKKGKRREKEGKTSEKKQKKRKREEIKSLKTLQNDAKIYFTCSASFRYETKRCPAANPLFILFLSLRFGIVKKMRNEAKKFCYLFRKKKR